MDLDLEIGDLRKSITFAIVDDLAVSLIIGTAYQEKLIESIHCEARRLKPANSRTVAILDTFDTPICTLESVDAQPKTVHVCRSTVVPYVRSACANTHLWIRTTAAHSARDLFK